MTAQPDLGLVADILDSVALYTGVTFNPAAIREQARLCREADNATGEAVTVNRSGGGEGAWVELPGPVGTALGDGTAHIHAPLELEDTLYSAKQMRAHGEQCRLATPEQPGSAVQGEVHAIAFVGSDGRPAWINDGEGVGPAITLPPGTPLYPPPAPAATDRIEAMRDSLDNAVKAVSGLEAPMPTVPELAARLRQEAAPAAEHGEVCESSEPDCGPVEFHDDHGIPLCRTCYEALEPETLNQRKDREAGLSVVETQPEARGVEEIAAGYITETAAKVLRAGFAKQSGLLHMDVTVFADKPPCAHSPIYLATPNPVRAEQPEGKGDYRATHHVHRGAESLPCYCPGKSDHPIGMDTLPSDPAAPGAGVGVDE